MAHSHVEYYQDSAQEWRWRTRDDNGNITGDSGQGYASKQKARQGFINVQSAAET